MGKAIFKLSRKGAIAERNGPNFGPLELSMLHIKETLLTLDMTSRGHFGVAQCT